jgi:hypothetical protein
MVHAQCCHNGADLFVLHLNLYQETIMKNYLQSIQQRFEAMCMAVTFAEAGEWDEARKMMNTRQKSDRRDSVKKRQPQQRRRASLRVY